MYLYIIYNLYIFLKSYVVADMYYVDKPTMATSTECVQAFFFPSFPKQYSVTTIYIAFSLY